METISLSLGWRCGNGFLLRWLRRQQNCRRAAQAKQEDRDDRVSNRYRGGNGQSHGLAMHETEEGEHRAGQSKGRSLHELLLDDEHADGTEHEAGQDGTTTENFESVIEHA